MSFQFLSLVDVGMEHLEQVAVPKMKTARGAVNEIFKSVRNQLVQRLLFPDPNNGYFQAIGDEMLFMTLLETQKRSFDSHLRESLEQVEEQLYFQYLGLTQFYTINGIKGIEEAVPWNYVVWWFYTLPPQTLEGILTFQENAQLVLEPPLSLFQPIVKRIPFVATYGHPEVQKVWEAKVLSPSEHWNLGITDIADVPTAVNHFYGDTRSQNKNFRTTHNNDAVLDLMQRYYAGFQLGCMESTSYLPTVIAAGVGGNSLDLSGYTVFPEAKVEYVMTEPTSPKYTNEVLLSGHSDVYTNADKKNFTTMLTSIHPEYYTPNLVYCRPYIQHVVEAPAS